MTSPELKPGENPTLSLCGNAYFFSGPKLCCGFRLPNQTGVTGKAPFDLDEDKYASVYVVLGPKNQFFRCIRPFVGDVASCNDSELQDYNDLTLFLDDQNVARPRFLSLGCNGHFYIRAETGVEKWDVPGPVTEQLLKRYTSGDASIEGLWLGNGDAFVAQRWDGTKVIDLRGQYPGLQRALERRGRDPSDEDADVVSVAMDLDGSTRYAVLWRDGLAECDEGMMGMESGREFKRWCDTNGYKLSL
ncbi:hypothetical protein BGZ63DRAFT_84007 [Mariannaea sp. PMI_226]|nr:hypothetical protein BGZ63DRAFT_84007 [Mariannaea sp. PMI_226]